MTTEKNLSAAGVWEIFQRGSGGRRNVRYIAWNLTRSGNLGERRASAAAAGKYVNEVLMAGEMYVTLPGT
jgi:hypothetical protein